MEYNLAKPSWWIRPLLFIAFAYSIAWGFIIIFWPAYVFDSVSLALPNYTYIWQSLGAIEVMLGISYLLTFSSPYRHWSPIVIGMGFKLLSAAIFFRAAMGNAELFRLGSYNIVHNLIWILPFAAILVNVYRRSFRADELLLEAFDDDGITLDMFDTTEGVDLKELTYRNPTMVVFLRHFGCTFCREALQDLSSQRKAIEAKGVKIVLVHMLEDEEEARHHVLKYGPGLDGLAILSDPEGILYKKFKLRRGTWWQLLGGKVLFRGFIAGIIKGNGLGPQLGDISQMPGVFVLHREEVIRKYVHQSSADRPKYIQIVELAIKKAA